MSVTGLLTGSVKRFSTMTRSGRDNRKLLCSVSAGLIVVFFILYYLVSKAGTWACCSASCTEQKHNDWQTCSTPFSVCPVVESFEMFQTDLPNNFSFHQLLVIVLAGLRHLFIKWVCLILNGFSRITWFWCCQMLMPLSLALSSTSCGLFLQAAFVLPPLLIFGTRLVRRCGWQIRTLVDTQKFNKPAELWKLWSLGCWFMRFGSMNVWLTFQCGVSADTWSQLPLDLEIC